MFVVETSNAPARLAIAILKRRFRVIDGRRFFAEAGDTMKDDVPGFRRGHFSA